MQPLTKHREVESGGVSESKAFEISKDAEDTSFLKGILRDGIYSDKVLAVLREYSANAWDAHRMAGKPDLPIKVQLPLWTDPVLVIEDYGPGLSHEEAFHRFTTYGVSTKRDTNGAVGMIGIGCKCGFAYSDTFTVISRHDGKKRTYAAVLDENDNDTFSLMSEEDHDPADTGLTIQIAVRKEDITEFHRKAKELFRHFRPRPVINIELPLEPKIAAKLQHGLIYDKNHNDWSEKQWFAVMGCVPYRIDLDQLRDSNGETLISESFKGNSGLLYFGIGEVQINASREALKYSKVTKEALVKKFEVMLEEFVKTILDEVENSGGTEWDKRVNLQRLLNLNLGKEELGELGENTVRLKPYPDELDFQRTHVVVDEASRFVRRTDTKRDLKGFELGDYDVLVEPGRVTQRDPASGAILRVLDETYPEQAAWAALEKLIQERKLTGIKVVDLHDLPWAAPPPPPGKRRRYSNAPYNAKHRVSTFRYLGTRRSTLSENWEVVKRVPDASDVFLVLDRFESPDLNFYQDYAVDRQVADHFGFTLPEIYGYKTTEKKPVSVTDTPGTFYGEWRKKFMAGLPVDKVSEMFQSYHWAQTARQWRDTLCRPETTLSRIWDELGRDHLVTGYLYKLFKARNRGLDYNSFNMLRNAGVFKDYWQSEPDRLRAEIHATYPLIQDAGLKALWKANGSEWLRYIRLVDAEKTVPGVTYADVAVPPTTEERVEE